MNGDDMKKTILLGLIFIGLGAVFGTFLNNTYRENLKPTFGEGNSYYFIQEGVYSSKEIMEENIKDLGTKLIEEDQGKYYVYLGITKEKSNAEKIQEIYEDKGYQLYVKERNITNEEFYNNVTQFDLLIKNTEDETEILTIEEVVLANYEELIKKEK